MIRVTYNVGHYGPDVKDYDVDSEMEALAELVEYFKEREGSRVPTPSFSYPLGVAFTRMEPESVGPPAT